VIKKVLFYCESLPLKEHGDAGFFDTLCGIIGSYAKADHLNHHGSPSFADPGRRQIVFDHQLPAGLSQRDAGKI
jgi:hypothetical protein